MSEEEVAIKLLGDSLVLRELFSIVARERVNAGCKKRQRGMVSKTTFAVFNGTLAI